MHKTLGTQLGQHRLNGLLCSGTLASCAKGHNYIWLNSNRYLKIHTTILKSCPVCMKETAMNKGHLGNSKGIHYISAGLWFSSLIEAARCSHWPAHIGMKEQDKPVCSHIPHTVISQSSEYKQCYQWNKIKWRKIKCTNTKYYEIGVQLKQIEQDKMR